MIALSACEYSRMDSPSCCRLSKKPFCNLVRDWGCPYISLRISMIHLGSCLSIWTEAALAVAAAHSESCSCPLKPPWLPYLPAPSTWGPVLQSAPLLFSADPLDQVPVGPIWLRLPRSSLDHHRDPGSLAPLGLHETHCLGPHPKNPTAPVPALSRTNQPVTLRQHTITIATIIYPVRDAKL